MKGEGKEAALLLGDLFGIVESGGGGGGVGKDGIEPSFCGGVGDM